LLISLFKLYLFYENLIFLGKNTLILFTILKTLFDEDLAFIWLLRFSISVFWWYVFSFLYRIRNLKASDIFVVSFCLIFFRIHMNGLCNDFRFLKFHKWKHGTYLSHFILLFIGLLIHFFLGYYIASFILSFFAHSTVIYYYLLKKICFWFLVIEKDFTHYGHFRNFYISIVKYYFSLKFNKLS
jgi:hypothetical protein